MNDHKKGEFGCLVSYLYFLKKFINSNLDIAIFSDDDLSFEENFSEKLNELITNNLPDNFNIIYLQIYEKTKGKKQISISFLMRSDQLSILI